MGRRVAAGLRRAADEAGQVVEVKPLRHQVRAQERELATGLHAGGACQVAVADLAGEAFVAPGVAVADEAPVESIRRRWRQRDAEQRSEEHTDEPQSLRRSHYDVFCLQ